MKREMSISEIAQICNVSTATVSRVINRKGGYSEKTAEMVLGAIEKYGYVPNMVAKGLRTKKTPIIGIIVPDIVNGFYSKMVLELQMKLFQSGYLTLLCNVNESDELERQQVSALLAQNISGLILISGRTSKLNLKDIPVIYIDRVPSEEEKAEHIFIESDNLAGAYMATKELIQNGCKRIAFLTDMTGESAKNKRYEGYCKALSETGMTIDESLLFRVERAEINEGKLVIEQAIEAGLEFDGVVCATDIIAVGAIQGILGKGLRVPEDIKITGFDDVELASVTSIPLTTIHQYNDKMAEFAADKMIEVLSGQEVEERYILVPVDLVVRKSSRDS